MTVRTEQDLRAALVDVPGIEAAERRLLDFVTTDLPAAGGAEGAGRRTLVPVIGGVAAAAAVVAGTVAISARHERLGTEPAAPVPTTSAPAAAPRPTPTAGPVAVTPQVVADVLRSLLPAGPVSGFSGGGTGVPRNVVGGLDYDDGRGSAFVSAQIDYGRYRPGHRVVWPSCGPDAGGDGYSHCRDLPDGTQITQVATPAGYTLKPQQRSVEFRRTDGVIVIVVAWNSRVPGDVATVTRPQPPFTFGQLETLARSPRWTAEVPAAAARRVDGLFVPDPAVAPAPTTAPARGAGTR